MTGPIEGLLLVDKPAGPTSHDVIARIRTLLGGARVGHTGTLDPGATGLLLVLIGAATRLGRFLPHEPKRYVGTIRLGIRTTTDDLDGEPTFEFDGAPPEPARVTAAALALTGRRLQTPPAVSARKVGGVRMYRLSRSGRPVSAPATEVIVNGFDVVPTEDPFRWSFQVEVSSGTYVRSLARDLGESLGCGGAVATLRRTTIGPFAVADAILVPARDAGGDTVRSAVVPLERLPFSLPASHLTDEGAAARFLSGGAVPATGSEAAAGDRVVFGPNGRLLGVGAWVGGMLRPAVVLPGPP